MHTISQDLIRHPHFLFENSRKIDKTNYYLGYYIGSSINIYPKMCYALLIADSEEEFMRIKISDSIIELADQVFEHDLKWMKEHYSDDYISEYYQAREKLLNMELVYISYDWMPGIFYEIAELDADLEYKFDYKDSDKRDDAFEFDAKF